KEIYALSAADQVQFLRELCWVSRQLGKIFGADKLNVGALGNQVSQLHIHHIVRYQNDAAWPNPAWGHEAMPYTQEVLSHMQQTLMMALRGHHQMPFDWKMDVC
ncbi:HIT family protein, partial [Moraxella catarrhalis]|uniref:HIT domain-containing protein n=1 Tax=Moraxella catarrhalis TaxID=480 RepID=UPI00128CB9DB